MRVLLIYSNQSRELVPAPPVGVSYVASASEAAGHSTRLLDLAFSRDVAADIRTAIRALRPEVVGLSIRNIDNLVQQRFESPQAALLAQIAVIRREARRADGTPVPLVLGGPAVSVLGEAAITIFDADFAVIGEGETSFPQLLSALEAGDSAALAAVEGLCWRREGEVVVNPVGRLGQFAGSGMERWVDWDAYQRQGGTWPIQTKRGCPMRCSYCSYPLIEGRRGRLREPAEVVDEIERVLRETSCNGGVRPRTFEFVDSTFNVPASHAIAICEEIIRRRVGTSFTAMGINPRDVPPELFPIMKRAGFNSVMITPESASPAMLENYVKGFTMAEVEQTLQHVRAAKLKSMWFFMLGGPGETMETCEESIAFARDRLRSRYFFTVFFTGIRVLPGTLLARQAIERGHLDPAADLSGGVFYLSPAVDEQRVIDRINAAIVRNPAIVHAAEGGSRSQPPLYRALNALRVAPPYWRFLPEFLGFPPLHFLRSRNPSIRAAG
ncbi:MAG TPA: radical SAM protein [Rhodocyclaceae bacterium]